MKSLVIFILKPPASAETLHSEEQTSELSAELILNLEHFNTFF